MSALQAPTTISLYGDCRRGLHDTHTQHTLVQRLEVAIRDGLQSLSSTFTPAEGFRLTVAG